MTGERKRLAAAPLRASVQRKAKRALTAAAFRAEAQRHALEALDALVWLAEHATSEAVRVSAANAVLDRAHGKPASGARTVGDEDGGEGRGMKVQWLDPAKS